MKQPHALSCPPLCSSRIKLAVLWLWHQGVVMERHESIDRVGAIAEPELKAGYQPHVQFNL